METIEGQILYRRAVSQRLVFYDVEVVLLSRVVELVVKIGDLTVEDVKMYRDTIRLGDCIRASGSWQGSHELRVATLEVLRRWQDDHPSEQFVPRAPCRTGAPAAGAVASATAPGEEQPENATATAAAASAPPRPAADPDLGFCKFWVNTGRCSKGALCPYAHPAHPDRRRVRLGWERDRAQERRRWAECVGFHQDESAAGRHARAAVFADWLVAAYGLDALNAGSGVLDVAGGRGAVAFELACRLGVKVLMVEPRPAKLSKVQKRTLAQAQTLPSNGQSPAANHPSAALAPPASKQPATTLKAAAATAASAAAAMQEPPSTATAPVGSECTPPPQTAPISEHTSHDPANQPLEQPTSSHSLPSTPPHHDAVPPLPSHAPPQPAPSPPATTPPSQHTDDSGGLFAALPSGTLLSCDASPSASHPAAGSQLGGGDPASTTEGSAASSRPTREWAVPQVQALFEPELWRSGEHASHLQGCSLVVGMHPDQATEAILQFAQEFRKPFAIVPCCVFPRQFPERRVSGPSGEQAPVQTYEQLVAYLMQQGAATEDILGFQGANRVVFRKAAP